MTREALEALTRAIAEACASGDLAAARARLGEAVRASADLELQTAMAEAEQAMLDWPRIAAEAVQADSHARSRGEPGCDAVIVTLGNHIHDRTQLTRTYCNAAAPRESDLAKYWAHVEPMEIDGIGALVALENSSGQSGESMEARSTRRALATQGIVLSFFASVVRHAAVDGLPLAARVRAEIAYFSGPEAIFQIGPAISFETSADRVAPGPAVERAAAALHAREAKAHLDATARLLDNMRRSYARALYVPTRGLPEELGETLVRLRQIEDRLIQDDLGGTTRPAEFQDILERVRTIREAQAPRPLNLRSYRTGDAN